MCGFISASSLLFQWSSCLFLGNNMLFLLLWLWDQLEISIVIPPTLFFLLRIFFAIWILLCFHMNVKNNFYTSLKNDIKIFMGIVLNLQFTFSSIAIFTIFCQFMNIRVGCLLRFLSWSFYSFNCSSFTSLVKFIPR
jgi:hypothetical protein